MTYEVTVYIQKYSELSEGVGGKRERDGGRYLGQDHAWSSFLGKGWNIELQSGSHVLEILHPVSTTVHSSKECQVGPCSPC